MAADGTKQAVRAMHTRITYFHNGGQDGGQLGGHALDERGRDAVEAKGGHLSVRGGVCVVGGTGDETA
jgi:hypothetical protein